jgi:hypothetical protein
MTSTLARKERFWVRLWLASRDGKNCRNCGAVPDSPHQLDIDHIDGNPANSSPANLRLLCRSCNTSAGIRRAQGIGTFLEREGEIAEKLGLPSADSTTALKSKVNYSSGSPEMQVNDAVETEFRSWAIGLLLRLGEYPLDNLIADGAERTGGSINAIRNYLKKMCSPLYGSLETFRVAGRGPTHVRIKAQFRKAISNEKMTPSEVAQGSKEGP